MIVKRPSETELLREDGYGSTARAASLNTPTPKRGKTWFIGMLLAMTVLCTVSIVQFLKYKGRMTNETTETNSKDLPSKKQPMDLDPTNKQEQKKQQQQQPQLEKETQEPEQQQEAWPENSIEVPKYPLRDVSNYSMSMSSMVRSANYGSLASCLIYECTSNSTECDTLEPTNYNHKGNTTDNDNDKQKPPCCIHILRDMAKVFDEEMSRLGLDYTAGFGTLLGLRRSDRLIPWTVDNDYIVESYQVGNAMVDLWNATKTGLAVLFQGIPRMCATKDFANGQLVHWEVASATNYKRETNLKDELWNQGYPYMDFYVGNGRQSKPHDHGGGTPDDGESSNVYFSEIRECLHLYDDVFPTKRVQVYGKSFGQNVPAHTDQVLADKYGEYWPIPNPRKSPHGENHVCGPSNYWKKK